MGWISDDPWPVVWVLLGVIGVLVVLLWLRQERRYLTGAIVLVGLAGVLLVIEHFWVTDSERVERVILELGRAVGRSDAEVALGLMSDEVSLTQGSTTVGGPQVRAVERLVPGIDRGAVNPARALLRATIERAEFDFLRIRRLEAQVGKRTRMGTADFRVVAAGSYDAGGVRYNFATGVSGSDWSVGVREVDGVWRIERITAVRMPSTFAIPGME